MSSTLKYLDKFLGLGSYTVLIGKIGVTFRVQGENGLWLPVKKQASRVRVRLRACYGYGGGVFGTLKALERR